MKKTDFENDNYDSEIEKEVFIFLINFHEKMFIQSKNIPFLYVIQNIAEILKRKVSTSPLSLVSFVFFNTKNCHNEHNFERIVVLLDLERICVETTKLIKSLKSLDCDKISIGTERADFFETLCVCQSLLTKKITSDYKYKRIFAFTNDDCPQGDSQRMKEQCETKLKELFADGVAVDVFPLGNEQNNFDSGVFFDFGGVGVISNDFHSLKRHIRAKLFPERVIAKCVFKIGDRINFSVDIFSFISQTKHKRSVFIDSETKEPLKVQKLFVSAETGHVLDENEVESYYSVGDKSITLSEESSRNIFDFGTKSYLSLVGFVNCSSDPILNVRSSYFVYPNEKRIKGSVDLFKTLLDIMASKKVHAICKLYTKKLRFPNFVKLLPNSKENGFDIVFLPYADDIRNINVDSTQNKSSNREIIDSAKEVVTNLTVSDFSPDYFEDPVMSRFYTSLEGVALSEDIEQKDLLYDPTLPNEQKMIRGAGNNIEIFKNILDSKIIHPMKRTRCDENFEIDRKKKQFDFQLNFEALSKENRLDQCTVAQLKRFCEEVGLTLGGKKADLVGRIRDYFTSKL